MRIARFALFTALVSCFMCGSLHAQTREFNATELALQKLLQDAGLANGTAAVMAYNLDNGQVIAEYQTNKSMVPASVQKLFTTAAILESRGPNYTFQTTLAHDGHILDGALEGNLYIIGSGDPSLMSRFHQSSPSALDQLAEGVKKAGITSINGQINIAAYKYNRYTTPRGWIWEDMGNYFGASPTSLMWRDNLLEVYLRSGQVGSPVVPADDLSAQMGLDLDIQVAASENNRDNAWFFGSPGHSKIYAKGTIPAHQSRYLVKAAHPDPMGQFARDLQLKTGLKARETRILYELQWFNDLQPIASITSPPLSALIRITNQHSVNLYAESFLLELDSAQFLKTTEGGLLMLTAGLKKHAVDLRGVRLVDGSGLSPLNRITCQSMIDVLGWMYRSPNRDAYMNSLAMAGQSGTPSNVFTHPTIAGRFAAKSGTMTGVRNYAGYLKNAEGQTIAVCIMLNDYDERRKAEIMAKIEALLIAVYEAK